MATANDREVTLLLSVATAAIVVPYERLRGSSDNHPAGDPLVYPSAKRKFNEAVNSSFLRSHRWGQGKSWQVVKKISEDVIQARQAEHWAAPEIRKPLPDTFVADSVINHLRNALAHGSIFTYPSRMGGDKPAQIETLVFLSESSTSRKLRKEAEQSGHALPPRNYDVLFVSPGDFRAFLEKWVEFLDSLGKG